MILQDYQVIKCLIITIPLLWGGGHYKHYLILTRHYPFFTITKHYLVFCQCKQFYLKVKGRKNKAHYNLSFTPTVSGLFRPTNGLPSIVV